MSLISLLFGDGGKHAPAGGAGAQAGGEGSAKRLDALAHGDELHAFCDVAAARRGRVCAIIGNDELVKRRMLHAPHGNGFGMGVAHGVGKRLAQHRRKAVGDVGGRMLGQNLKLNLRTAVRARAFDDAFELHGEVGRIVVERVDAGAHELERLVNGVFDVGEIGGNAGLVGMDHAQGFGLKRSARELVAHVIVDLAREAGAFGERRELDFVVLAVGEVAVARLECQGAFLQLVAGATHAFLFALQLRGAQ